MNDKKGFTLIELLAVIAILSILLIIAVTGVLNIYNNIKEESFVVETKGLIRNAKNNATKQLFTTNGLICFDNTTSNKQLDVDGRSLEYYILFNNDGNLINVEVGDQKFYIKASGEKIQQDELGSRKSEKKYITKERKETDILPLCLALNLKKMTFEDSDTRPTEIFTDGNNVYTEDARQTISELTIVPERYGYIFQGYIYEDENGNEYEIINKNGKVVKDYLNKITKETVLKGKWERNIYVVNYDNNGGQGEMSSSTYTYGVSDKLRKNTFTKSGSIFKGWSTTAGGVVEYADEKEILNLTLEESITLYAVWEECGSGTYSDDVNNVCSSCPVGYYCVGGNRIPCKNGYTNNGGQTEETSCKRTVAAGQQVTTAGGAPSACPANSYSTEKVISQTETYTCTGCANGYTVAEGTGTAATSCKRTVAAGQQVTTAGGAPSNCGANSYSTGKTINQTETYTCTNCASGYTVTAGAGKAATNCTRSIPAGKRVTTAGGAPVNCAANTYAGQRTINQTQTSGCTNCADGYTVAEGLGTAASTCTRSVPAGQQVATAGGAPSACPANQIAASARTINQTQTALCSACGSGYHSNTAHTACEADDTTPPTCVLAANGSSVYFQSKTDNVGVTAYGVDKSSAAAYNNATSTAISTGTFYGHVKDAAGLTGTCSITIAGTQQLGNCSWQNGGKQCNWPTNTETSCYAPGCYFRARKDNASLSQYCTNWPSGTYCFWYYDPQGYIYNCPGGYTKINDSYCWAR